jgi:hypothetical protein
MLELYVCALKIIIIIIINKKDNNNKIMNIRSGIKTLNLKVGFYE